MSRGRIALGGIQFAGLREEKTKNIETATRMIREAAGRGAQIIMTPEVVLTGYVGGEAERRMAEPIPGPTTELFASLAKELDAYLLVGMSELLDGEIHNAMAVLSRDGSLMGVMRKVHINKYETAYGWRNGSEFPVWQFATETGTMTGGIMICYDREVPESARVLMLKDVDVIFNPLACRCPKDEIHRCLLRTRAFENEVYVFMVNHAEPSQNGHSFAVDFNGYIRSELDEAEGLLWCEVDLDALERHRAQGIYGKHHRRPELYASLCDPAGQIHPDNANLPPVRTRSA
ncbi:MAG: carbon-nitrogen hydrolase family protein [Candidatus Hydrogenedentes bacterium]|nr:carbon-nitrogen hydrolase family protein [Candidatus Hydrogenedentota bacterium]